MMSHSLGISARLALRLRSAASWTISAAVAATEFYSADVISITVSFYRSAQKKLGGGPGVTVRIYRYKILLYSVNRASIFAPESTSDEIYPLSSIAPGRVD
jgi:hypothetical protein